MIKEIKVILYITCISVTGLTYCTDNEPKIVSLFSHGIAASGRQAYRYAQITPSTDYNNRHIINNHHHILACFNYPDAGEGARINRRETSLAQANELKALHDAHTDIGADTGVIGLGVSRGASAFITWLGTHPDESKVQNIRALILESPFDSIDSVIRYMIGESLYQRTTMRSLAHRLASFVFSKYDKNFITPLEAAAKVPLTIPIIIICSAQDTRVPASLSRNLYEELVRTGHTNAHFVKLQHGFHGRLIQGADSRSYRNAVHAFYQKYDLPYHADYAEAGKAIIEASQPISIPMNAEQKTE